MNGANSTSVVIGESTIIPVFACGRLSHLPLRWWMRSEGRLEVAPGVELRIEPFAESAAVLITSGGYYMKAEEGSIFWAETLFKLWGQERWVPSKQIKSRVLLDGAHGAYSVKEVERMTAKLYRVNVPMAAHLCTRS